MKREHEDFKSNEISFEKGLEIVLYKYNAQSLREISAIVVAQKGSFAVYKNSPKANNPWLTTARQQQ